MNNVKNYLRLSSDYCRFLGGVRWSSSDDALVYPDGATFAFNEEVAQFLEGLGSGGRLPHFGHALHLLDLLRDSRIAHPEAGRLRQVFLRAGRSRRNAGAFLRAVCRDLPEAAGGVDAQEVCDRLRNPSMPIRWFLVSFHDTFAPAEQAPLDPDEFERRILSRTAAYTDDELHSWFLNGRGPIKDAGEALARAMPRRTLEGALAALLRRPRLAGAGGFVAQLVGALTLPPRRLERLELPVGGYSDVTAHGRLDQILPSQFALDELDFLRRLAEHELLYFRREEPPRPTRQEMAVLLDQGVRTWGDVRLVLGAAVLALGRLAARRGVPFCVATTGSRGELLDPLRVDEEALGQTVEGSDLSANPGLALERMLETASDSPRDLVLLTHPRSLNEDDVRAAARRLGPRDRLFALTLDGRGTAELSELRRGVPVKLRQFHVDFTRSAPRLAPVPDDSPADALPLWRGDVEPVGYPFRFGVAGSIGWESFAFDQAGEWLLAVADHGMLYAWKTDGSRTEILPRGLRGEALLTAVAGLVGVAGGFAVVGTLGDEMGLFHYDFAARTCTGHKLGRSFFPWGLYYLPGYHTVIAATPTLDRGWALDLATGRRVLADDTLDPAVRAAAAWQQCLTHGLPVVELVVIRCGGPENVLAKTASRTKPTCQVNIETGQVMQFGSPPTATFTPCADGRPLLKGCIPHAAKLRANVLAVLTVGGQGEGVVMLRLFRCDDRGGGAPLAAFAMNPQAKEFTLSPDGHWLARTVKRARLEIRRVSGDAPPVLTKIGGFSGRPSLVLGWQCLLIRSGKRHAYLLRWDQGRLEWARGRDSGAALMTTLPQLHERGKQGMLADVPPFLGYDRTRFVAGATGWNTTVVADRYGQVAVFREGQLLCMFIALREHLAGWMPDGTRFGPAWLTGGPESPGAMEKFGRALLRASDPEKVPS